eukprot:4157852-Amphidinium_carterae.1
MNNNCTALRLPSPGREGHVGHEHAPVAAEAKEGFIVAAEQVPDLLGGHPKFKELMQEIAKELKSDMHKCLAGKGGDIDLSLRVHAACVAIGGETVTQAFKQLDREMRLAASIALVTTRMPEGQSAKVEWARFLRDESKLCTDFSSQVLAARKEKLPEDTEAMQQAASLEKTLSEEAKAAVCSIMSQITQDLEARGTLPSEGKSWKDSVPLKCSWKVLMETAGPLTGDQRVHDLNARYKKAVEACPVTISDALP